METNDKSVLDTILGALSGETKPEVIVTTKVEVDNNTLWKVIGGLTLVGLAVIAFNQWAWRSTLRRFFPPL